MDRLKKLWNCYKEKSLDRPGNSISSNSSTASANNNVYDVKVADDENQLIVCFSFSFFFFPFYSPHTTNPHPTSTSTERNLTASKSMLNF